MLRKKSINTGTELLLPVAAFSLARIGSTFALRAENVVKISGVVFAKARFQFLPSRLSDFFFLDLTDFFRESISEIVT